MVCAQKKIQCARAGTCRSRGTLSRKKRGPRRSGLFAGANFWHAAVLLRAGRGSAPRSRGARARSGRVWRLTPLPEGASGRRSARSGGLGRGGSSRELQLGSCGPRSWGPRRSPRRVPAPCSMPCACIRSCFWASSTTTTVSPRTRASASSVCCWGRYARGRSM